MLFGLGPVELSLISIALLMLFGDRLPKLAGSLARAVVNFKNALQEVNISRMPLTKRKEPDTLTAITKT